MTDIVQEQALKAIQNVLSSMNERELDVMDKVLTHIHDIVNIALDSEIKRREFYHVTNDNKRRTNEQEVQN